MISLALIAGVLFQKAPLSPQEAPEKMTLPEGFRCTLFAGEPDVVQPIAFTFDDRGRLWVVECLSYPHWLSPGQAGRDRVVIFEDLDGDGRFDTKKVFAEHLANVTGIAVGHGGIWLTAVPYLQFIPDRNRDDIPDGPAEILLDGWDLKGKHNVLNKPTWGPDGWLYGCNGILSNSRVGAPGTPDAQRIPINCGVWRFHPVTRKFEVVAHGTTNPWGIDWDEFGRAFITNCVIKHVFQVIPGAHYERMFGEDRSADAVYGLMPSCADHIHWAGGSWTESRSGEQNSQAGGGHAHVGAMVYLGNNWPDAYRGHLFTMNLHGHRMSHDFFESKGSGVVARHGKDFLLANDPWFRGLDCQYGPDGGVFVSDWTDTGECHNYDRVDISNGRLYKITYGVPKKIPVDLFAQPDLDLVSLLSHRNAWFVRHALRLLYERALAGRLDRAVLPALSRMSIQDPNPILRLHARWALHLVDPHSPSGVDGGLDDACDQVRARMIELAFEEANPAEGRLRKLTLLAKEDPSPAVRLAIAGALQRLPLSDRLAPALALAAHEEDGVDPNLPLMYWYAFEPLVAHDRSAALQLLATTKLPLVRRLIARRLAAETK